VRLLLVQVTTGTDPLENRDVLRRAVVSAVEDAGGPGSCDLVVLPEAAQADFGTGDPPPAAAAEPLDGPFASVLAGLAEWCGATVVGGLFESIPATGGGASASSARTTEPPFNTLLAVRPDGSQAAAYRKVHLYDAFGYRESDVLTSGAVQACTLDVEGWTVGLMTCYDLRFPEQVRALVDAGADLVVVPAAWVRGPAKEHHWSTLLAARAIENTVYVAGVAKAGGRYCGLTRLVDPMGQVVAGLGEADGSVSARLDRARLAQVRATNPSLANRRWTVTPRP
jgi:predicted amidohydrolase